MKKLIKMLIRDICLVFPFLVITTPLHEFGHWFVANLAGNEGIIFFDHFGAGGWFRYTSDPPYHFDWLVELSGGLTVFVVLGSIGAIRMRQHGFPTGWIPLVCAVIHLIYGIIEMAVL